MSFIGQKTCFKLKPQNILDYSKAVGMLVVAFDVKIEELKKNEIRCYSFTVEGCSYIEKIAKDSNCSVKRVTTMWEDIDDNK